MNRLLRHPYTNLFFVVVFSTFYATVFFITAGNERFIAALATTHYAAGTLMAGWSALLASGGQAYIAGGLLVITAMLIVLLITHRCPYDEYHTAVLLNCFVVSLALILLAIAALFCVVLLDPAGIVEKFMLFILIHWATVLACDAVYTLTYGRK